MQLSLERRRSLVRALIALILLTIAYQTLRGRYRIDQSTESAYLKLGRTSGEKTHIEVSQKEPRKPIYLKDANAIQEGTSTLNQTNARPSLESYRHMWEEHPSALPLVQRQRNLMKNIKGIMASDLLQGQPVYVSITTVKYRVHGLAKMIKMLIEGSFVPTHIYILISSEPYLMDDGISKSFLPKDLLNLTNMYPISIIYTHNNGPHRKLLPILYEQWYENCVIITLDDDVSDLLNVRKVVSELVLFYLAAGKNAIVALQAKRIGYCLNPSHRVEALLPYNSWNHAVVGTREMLVLPIGTGGVLYRPQFFHPIVFDERLRLITRSNDDLTFRMATLVNRIPIVVGCWKKSIDMSFISCSRANIVAVQRARRLESNDLIQQLKKKKKRELWRLNCNLTGNDVMLPQAAHFLEDSGLLQFMKLSDALLPLERGECFMHADASRVPKALAVRLTRCNIQHDCPKQKPMLDLTS